MRQRHRRYRYLATLLAPVVGLLTAGAATASAEPATADDSFYDPPSPLPSGSNGDIIKSEESDFFIDPAEFLSAPADVQRIMYHSTDTHGDPIATTGTVLTPDKSWSGDGDRPIIGYAPGTQGIGNECAPSKKMEAGLEYEGPFIAGLLERGYGVVVPDYEGLGTPGMHTYMNRASQGHTVLDGVRAAQRDSDADLPDAGPVAIAGYSQGGGASASAAELQPDYAPELDVKGAYAGAVPADLDEVARTLDGHYAAGFLGYALHGMNEAYPELDIPGLLNDEGQDLMEDIKTECTVEAIAAHAFTDSTDLTADGKPLGDYLEEEPYASRVAEQQIGQRSPDVPMLVVHSTLDDIVPYDQGKTMAQDWCDQDATVQFSKSHVPTHIGGMFRAFPEAFGWLEGRFADEDAPNNCGEF